MGALATAGAHGELPNAIYEGSFNQIAGDGNAPPVHAIAAGYERSFSAECPNLLPRNAVEIIGEDCEEWLVTKGTPVSKKPASRARSCGDSSGTRSVSCPRRRQDPLDQFLAARAPAARRNMRPRDGLELDDSLNRLRELARDLDADDSAFDRVQASLNSLRSSYAAECREEDDPKACDTANAITPLMLRVDLLSSKAEARASERSGERRSD